MDEPQASGPVPATSAKPDDSEPPNTTLLAQRSVSSTNLPQQEFDAQSVQFAQNVALKIEQSQSVDYLRWTLSKELKEEKWSVKFRQYSNPVHFDKYSGYVLDSSMRPRIEFGGSVIHPSPNCSVTVLTAEQSEQIQKSVNLEEYGNVPRNEFPENENLRFFYLMRLADDFKRGEQYSTS
ncbi:hypothetical protein [Endozoicomonas sp. YOMI1]|uniref:hypothetical protein n=1 Tax=Endozoicomonas sp. YOMI1 TaxID=2828739 RepID=UPI002148801D|nr:hypothetical protein [Endozoicomonas sp. YOMI1]